MVKNGFLNAASGTALGRKVALEEAGSSHVGKANETGWALEEEMKIKSKYSPQ